MAVAAMLLRCAAVSGRPMTAHDAEMIVTGWLKAAAQPLGTNLGRRVMNVETFGGDAGAATYHIVSLQPSGFVIVSADEKR